MKNRHLSALVTLLLSFGLVLGAPTSAAAAKVKPRDTPTRAQIVKLFPGVKNGHVDRNEVRAFPQWRKRCGDSRGLESRSGQGIDVTRMQGRRLSVRTDVGQFYTLKHAKKLVRSHKRFAKRCTRFRMYGDVHKVRRIKLPKVGQQRVGYRLTASDGGEKTYVTVAVVRRAKRVATTWVEGDRRVSVKPVRRLARVSARRMK